MIHILGLMLALQVEGEAGPATELLDESPDQIEIRGNRRVPSSLIRSLVELDSDSLADLAVAAEALEARLVDAGFILAKVRVALEDDRFVLVMDEGTVERVVFSGESALSAARANFIFRMEDRVFNEEDFREAVARLEKSLGREAIGLQIRRRAGGQGGFQLSNISKEVPQLVGLLEEGRYVVVLELADAFMSPGWGLGVEATGPDGLITALEYGWASVFMEDDRLQTSASIGLRVSELIGNTANVPIVSRGGLGVLWLSAELSDRLRWYADLGASYLNRQRLDLEALSYNLLQPELVTGLTWVERSQWDLEVGIGADFRSLLAGGQLPTGAPRPTTDGVLRALLSLKGSARLLPSTHSLRRDQYLELSLSIRGVLSAQSYVATELEAARSLPVGRYSEVRLRLQGAGLGGNPGLIDEYRVSDYFRGLYGDTLFSAGLAKSNVELFLSLEREYLRVSGFVEGLAAAGSRFADTGFRGGGATGLGIHTLFLQTIQGSIYGVVGVLNGEPIDAGINLSLTRLF